jgi:hypothetical protein
MKPAGFPSFICSTITQINHPSVFLDLCSLPQLTFYPSGPPVPEASTLCHHRILCTSPT